MKIEEAKKRLANAEEAMSLGLQKLEPELRGDKTIISTALKTAFAEVGAAKRGLIELEELIVPEE